jgi:hypothetical protein
MSKYIMIYKMAEPFDFGVLPPSEIQKVAEVWGEWLGTFGPKLVDRGEQFKFGGKTVSKNGNKDADNLLSGYSVIEADSLDEALDKAKGSPIINNGGSVEVYEVFAA